MTDSSPLGSTVWEQVRHRLAQIQAARTQRADPAALAERLARRATILRNRPTGAAPIGPQWKFLAFSKGRERFGIFLEDVIEVQPLDQFSLVPQAPAFIPGVVHFRGAIVSLLDLGRLLDIPESGLADLHSHIIVEAAGKRIAVVASRVEEIVRVAADQIKQAPDVRGKAPPEWIAGVHDGNRILVRISQLVNDAQLVQWRQDGASDLRRTGA